MLGRTIQASILYCLYLAEVAEKKKRNNTPKKK